VQTEEAAEKTVVPGIESTGEIQRNENTTVHVPPLIPGVITSVEVDLGTDVAAGDVLFTINSTEFGRSVTEYQRGRALTELAKKTYDREQGLFDQKVTSEQDLIEARMAYEEHKADLAAAEQTLHVLGLTEGELKKREQGHGTQIGLLPVRAPISGTILERHAVIGELVEEGGEVVLLSDLSTLWVWIDVYEQDLEKLLAGGSKATIPISLTVRAFPGRVFKGTIDYVGGTMEERTRTVKVRGVVQNEDRALRPGMFCQATIAAGDSEEVLAIPAGAVLSDEGTSFVFKHWKDDYYVRRAVRLGRTFSNGVEILEGIEPGDAIVTEGAFLLKSDILREKMGAGCAD
jgi:cobalt-zinc-cadmium efflux system membrane fusion protein